MFPKLRFKEFDENWKEVTLKNCITSIDSGWSPQCESYPANSSEWGVLKTTSVDWSGFNSSFNKKLPLELTPRKEIEVKPLDILVTRAGPTERVGVVSVVPHSVRSKLMISDKLIRLKSNEENNPLFLGISLSSVKCQNQLQSKTSGLAKSQTNISQKILGEVLLKLPSKEEQTKIASFLSAVDEKISQLTKKHELLSQYKQGMMQKLFSQQLRFKADDGSEFGEWGEYKIFDLAIDKTLNNGVFNDQNKVGKGYKLINVLDMYIQRDIDESRLSLLDIDKKEFERNKVNYGDIFFTRSSLVKEGIAFSNVYLGVSNDITYDGHLIKLSPDLNIIEPKFLNYCLKVAYVRKQLIQGGKTATMTTIGQQEVGNTLVKIPCLEEQIRIANFLSAIDQKIDVVSKQIEQAKQWKKGLLQQMFV